MYLYNEVDFYINKLRNCISLLCMQIENVKNVQEALKEALSELEKAKSADEVKFLENQVGELKNKSDQMVVVLKVSVLIE